MSVQGSERRRLGAFLGFGGETKRRPYRCAGLVVGPVDGCIHNECERVLGEQVESRLRCVG